MFVYCYIALASKVSIEVQHTCSEVRPSYSTSEKSKSVRLISQLLGGSSAI